MITVPHELITSVINASPEQGLPILADYLEEHGDTQHHVLREWLHRRAWLLAELTTLAATFARDPASPTVRECLRAYNDAVACLASHGDFLLVAVAITAWLRGRSWSAATNIAELYLLRSLPATVTPTYSGPSRIVPRIVAAHNAAVDPTADDVAAGEEDIMLAIVAAAVPTGAYNYTTLLRAVTSALDSYNVAHRGHALRIG